jgi:hypothetical protein
MAAAEGNPYKVILVGENHEDDLGEALSEVFGEFVNADTLKKYGFTRGERDFVFYYETPKTDKQVKFTFRSKLVTRTLLPLEEVAGVLSRGNVFDSVVQESLPAVMTSIFYLLNSLSQLMEYYSDPADFNGVAIHTSGSSGSPVDSVLSDIEYRLPEVIINCNEPQFRQFRTRMTAIFPDQQSVRQCIKSPSAVLSTPNPCMEKFINLYEIVREYFESFKTTHAQYAHIVFPTRPLRLMSRVIPQIIHDARFSKMSEDLIKELQSQRDDLMVAKLKSSIDASIAGGGNPRQISVVVVGNDHFVNMKRLLSTSPFELIFTKSTRKEPQIRAVVRIQYFNSRPVLNGRFGIVTGDSDRDGRTPVFYGDVSAPPLILERDNFEVLRETSTDESLRGMFPPQAYHHLIKLLTPVAPLKPGGALVKIKNLKSRLDLNGKHGIVTGPADSSSGRTPVFCGDMDITVKPLGLKSENFDVVNVTPTDADLEGFFTPEQIAYAKSLNGGSKRYKKGSKRYKKSSKLYKKGSKRRCYARTRKGKISKRRSAKKY